MQWPEQHAVHCVRGGHHLEPFIVNEGIVAGT